MYDDAKRFGIVRNAWGSGGVEAKSKPGAYARLVRQAGMTRDVFFERFDQVEMISRVISDG